MLGLLFLIFSPDEEEIKQKISNKKANEEQTKEKLDNLKFILSRLPNLQWKLFYYVLEKCLYRKNLTSGKISTKDMARVIKCSYGTAKMILNRLIKKHLIIRLKGKTSFYGYVSLALPEQVKMIGLEIKKTRNI